MEAKEYLEKQFKFKVPVSESTLIEIPFGDFRDALELYAQHVTSEKRDRKVKILNNGDVLTKTGDVIGDASQWVKEQLEINQTLRDQVKQFEKIPGLKEAKERIEELDGFDIDEYVDKEVDVDIFLKQQLSSKTIFSAKAGMKAGMKEMREMFMKALQAKV